MIRVVFPIVTLLAVAGMAAPVLRAAAGLDGRDAVQDAEPSRTGLVAQNATFAVFFQGVRRGSEDLSVARDSNGWIITGAERMDAAVDRPVREAEIRYGLDFRPQRLRLLGYLSDQLLDLTTTFDSAGNAHSVIVENGVPSETTVAVGIDTIVLPSNFFGAYAALGARLATSAPGAELRVFVAPQGEVPLVLKEVVNERVQTNARTFAVRRHRVTFGTPGSSLDMEIQTEEDGKLVGVNVPSALLEIARLDIASVSARQQRFFRTGDEDVRMPANGFTIAGTISKPAAIPSPPAGQKTTRLPIVVLVPGAGTVDRDEVVQGIPIFGQLAGGLADAGLLVLRYDKRGVGQSGGRSEAASLTDYADDLQAIVKSVANRKDVDSKRIVVAGHSEGAWVALLAASRTDRISRVALIAAPGTPGAQLALEQQVDALKKITLPEEEKRQRIELQRRIHAALLTGGSWNGIPDAVRRQADTPWFTSFLAFDPAATIRKVDQPILIVAAERDRQVPSHHADMLAFEASRRKKDRSFKRVTIPGINHLLVPAATGEIEEYLSLPDRTISPAVATAITSWLTQAPTKGGSTPPTR
jgi:pimeloyl-ACP methyl ester carboxylesterase